MKPITHAISVQEHSGLLLHSPLEHTPNAINFEDNDSRFTLLESEQKGRALVDSFRDAIITIKPPFCRFTSGNLIALKMFNVKCEADFLTHSLGELSPERQPGGLDSAGEAQKMIEKALREGFHSFEWMHRRIGGEEFPATVLLSRVELNGKVFLQGVLRDITDSKRMESLLYLQSRALEAAANAIVITDSKGAIVWANSAFATYTGYSLEEAIGKNPRLLKSGQHDAKFYQDLWITILAGKVWHGEMINRRKDGTLYNEDLTITPVRGASGTIEHFVAVKQDITLRKQIETRIAEQAALLDKTQDGIVVRDLEGKILFWNKGAESIYGWTSQEAVGRSILEAFRTDQKIFEELNELTIKHGQWEGEVNHLTKDGREITSEVRCTLIRDGQGRPKSILSVNTDITEKKKIEAQFMRAQRMESIGTLAGGIAHDLNNILAPIMMSIDILEAMVQDPQAAGILKCIKISSARGADIVRQVLSFARGMEGERIEIQPKHLLKELEHMIKDTFPKNIRLHFSISNDLYMILSDPTQVHQILMNLCVNARDAMPNGGDLTIGVENCEFDEHYAAMNRQAKAGHYINISVTDSGTGMPPGLMDKIFGPFFTTKELHKGTGLGLSTVMTIVKSHEGLINVYSEPGKGTTFKVYLPATESSAEVLRTQQVSSPRGKGETILVVDDEVSILTITNRTLQAFGYNILAAVDGAQAVAIYAQFKDTIAAVLTDMMMPIMDGGPTIRALTRINPTVKIIAASGLNTNADVAKLSGTGVRHFLTKPYTAATLLETIRTVLDEA